VGRAFDVGPAAGQTVGDFERSRNGAVTIERVQRGAHLLETTPEFPLERGDVVFVRGRRNAVIAVTDKLGDEVPVPQGTGFALVSRDVVLLKKEAIGRRMRDLKRLAALEVQRGVFISHIRRMGQNVPPLSGTILQQGDVLTLYGSESAVARAVKDLGGALPRDEKTDFIFLGLGIAAGLIIGHLSLKIGALELTLGSGGGALISGLIFGWLHMRHPRYGNLPSGAAKFAKDFGLAAFIAAIGLSAGPDAVKLVKQYGLILPVLGLLVSSVPALISLLVGWKLMKIETPILLGIIAGQHCSTPALSALVSQAGNSTPVIGYTVTYAISNVLLPLMGPVVVAISRGLTG
jgi:AspT/YidE/YbjL antiporter-like protein